MDQQIYDEYEDVMKHDPNAPFQDDANDQFENRCSNCGATNPPSTFQCLSCGWGL